MLAAASWWRTRVALGLFIALALSLLVAPFNPAQRAEAAETVSSTLTPVADTYVSRTYPTSNYGTKTTLKVSSSANRGFLRFNTTEVVPEGYTLSRATLRFYVSALEKATGAYEVHPQSNSWTETGVTWNSQPPWDTTVLALSPTPARYAWTSIDLPTGAISAAAPTSLALRYSASGISTAISSRQATRKPQLVLEFAPVSANQTAVAASEDTFTNSNSPDTNYGSSASVMATSSDRRGYLRYATAGIVPDGQRLASASLRLFVKKIAVTKGGFDVRPAGGAWSESATTWNNQPPLSSTVLSVSPTPKTGQWITVPLPVEAIKATQATPLTLRYTAGSSQATFSSRETLNRPYLLLTFEAATTTEPAPTPTEPAPAGYPVVMATGDISCDPASTESSTTCQQMAVSDLLVAQAGGSEGLGAVLTLGDNQYSDGQLYKFVEKFHPSLGRVKPLIRPASGNHEYADPAGPAKGFFDYFNGEGQATGPAGDRDKGYYSFDIAAADGAKTHFIALNSECSKIGGCGAGSPQQTWLAADLAANTTQCTVAYWHRPRFASSSGGHAGTTTMGRIWNDLVTAGVDVVLNGHNHNVEIMKPIGITPEANAAPVLDPAGPTQFIVGNGGKGFYSFGSAVTLASDGTAATFSREDDTFGALKLTLRPNAIDWRMVPVAGDIYNDTSSGTSGIFSGTVTC